MINKQLLERFRSQTKYLNFCKYLDSIEMEEEKEYGCDNSEEYSTELGAGLEGCEKEDTGESAAHDPSGCRPDNNNNHSV